MISLSRLCFRCYIHYIYFLQTSDPGCHDQSTMATEELNVDNLITRLLEGKPTINIFLWATYSLRAKSAINMVFWEFLCLLHDSELILMFLFLYITNIFYDFFFMDCNFFLRSDTLFSSWLSARQDRNNDRSGDSSPVPQIA